MESYFSNPAIIARAFPLYNTIQKENIRKYYTTPTFTKGKLSSHDIPPSHNHQMPILCGQMQGRNLM